MTEYMYALGDKIREAAVWPRRARLYELAAQADENEVRSITVPLWQETVAERDEALQELTRVTEELEDLKANPRDEFHTMDELYYYRMLYNAHAAEFWHFYGDAPVVKSWRHHDGELCFGGGWFIVTVQLHTGQVSNHYKAEYWDLFRVREVEVAPEWDGHTPAEAAERLRLALVPDPLLEG